eukprot:GDKJ01026021.1.p1 GENE.GDKJ01026021.1~~GDKJ01026021.1.p1  ORF type:complete len:371 (-),score=73.60 GDKJ01026021.1:77-1189(-)
MSKKLPEGKIFDEYFIHDVEKRSNEEVKGLMISEDHPYFQVEKYISTFKSPELVRRYFFALEKLKIFKPNLSLPDLQLKHTFRDEFYHVAVLPSLSQHKLVAHFPTRDILHSGEARPDVLMRWFSALMIYQNPNDSLTKLILNNSRVFSLDPPPTAFYLAAVYGAGSYPEILRDVLSRLSKPLFSLYPYYISSLCLWNNFELAEELLADLILAEGGVLQGHKNVDKMELLSVEKDAQPLSDDDPDVPSHQEIRSISVDPLIEVLANAKEKISNDYWLFAQHISLCIKIALKYGNENCVNFWKKHPLYSFFEQIRIKAPKRGDMAHLVQELSAIPSTSTADDTPLVWAKLKKNTDGRLEEVGIEKMFAKML